MLHQQHRVGNYFKKELFGLQKSRLNHQNQHGKSFTNEPSVL